MRRWSHEKKAICAGSAGTGRADGIGACRGVSVALGGGVLTGGQNRLQRGHAA